MNTVKSWRLHRGMARSEIAKACSTNVENMRRIEETHSNPSVELALKIAGQLKVSVTTLFGDGQFMPEEEAKVSLNGEIFLFSYVCDKMDTQLYYDVLCANLHIEWDEQEFVNAYVKAHSARFGEEFYVE